MVAVPRAAAFPSAPGRDECHLWTVTLPELQEVQEYLASLLDDAERARADRARHDIARGLFVTSRAAQRVLAERANREVGGRSGAGKLADYAFTPAEAALV